MKLDPITQPLAFRARIYAAGAHAAIDQRRKYSTEPYIVHPISVACILSNYGYEDDIVLAAALLHDVIEDTKITAEELRSEFKHIPGAKKMIKAVVELTNVDRSFGNRATRKAEDRRRLSLASKTAHLVKCADILDNITGISQRDPKFGEVYASEALQTLNVLTLADDEMLTLAKHRADKELHQCSLINSKTKQ
ncbi:(p)ppGpp synthase/HD superfamily hydrolase [Ochrobactrum sp. P20RRXII]|nr:HD domain-containing protein [Ochrobactrum sp. P20RRXII]NIH77384.1 (p)ppGpp synthase/HD superfamily hydrolase [Ochrobactrum sp. P20RRXII]